MWLILLLLMQDGLEYEHHNLIISSASVTNVQEQALWQFSINVEGSAGQTVPKSPWPSERRGRFGLCVCHRTWIPKWLASVRQKAYVALAVTSQPDFDDTPLWDEDMDGDYANDGVVYHTHWVVLGEDTRVPGGLSVVAAEKASLADLLPPTNPGMPMYMDSPGFEVRLHEHELSVFVPQTRLHHQGPFKYDAVSAFLKVSTKGEGPMLGVYRVYSDPFGRSQHAFSIEIASFSADQAAGGRLCPRHLPD